MVQTEEIACTFVLRETTTSQYAIVCQPRDARPSVLRGSSLMLKLRPGLSFGHAEQITKFLQENVTALIVAESQI